MERSIRFLTKEPQMFRLTFLPKIIFSNSCNDKQYAGHFHISKMGYLFDFTSTHVISAPVIINFWSVFHTKPFFLCRHLWRHWYQKMWNFRSKWKVCPGISPYSNAYAKVEKWIFDVQFPGNWFEFGIIWNDFWSSTIWDIQIQVSFVGFKNH